MFLISVLLPSYNHARFVSAAMRSVYAQSFTDYELIVLDDGSTDGSQNVIHKTMNDYGKAAKTRFIEREKNLGAVATLNELLNAATGEFVALINSDDEFVPTKLERQLARLRAVPEAAACFTWASLIDEDGAPYTGAHFYDGLFDCENATSPQWLKRLFFEGNCLCHPTIMARRKLFTLRYDERMAKLPDYDMWVRLLMRHEITVLKERLTRFRILDGNKNASAKCAATLNLVANETAIVLDNYRFLSREQASVVFGADCEPSLRRFYAYKAALALSPAAAAWGLRGLYAMLGEPEEREKLKGVGFTERELIALAQQFDVYGELPVTAKLYYADAKDVRRCEGAAFAEARCVPVKLNEGDFTARFPLLRKVTALRFDPSERPCKVRLKSAALVYKSGKTADVTPLFAHNGERNGDEAVFNHNDASFTCRLSAEVKAEELVVEGRVETW